MRLRHTTFAVLRRLALQDFAAPQNLHRRATPAARLLHYRATAPLRSPKPAMETSEKTPHYELTFTCKPCSERSSHKVSKQGYHFGSVLITCPGCKNRHVISDHLKIFTNDSMSIEDLMREKGQLVKKGTLSEDGDLEFWDDGTTTQRTKPGGDDKEEL